MSPPEEALPVVAHLVKGGRIFIDQVMLRNESALVRVKERKDGSSIEPLCSHTAAIAQIEALKKQLQQQALQYISDFDSMRVLMERCEAAERDAKRLDLLAAEIQRFGIIEFRRKSAAPDIPGRVEMFCCSAQHKTKDSLREVIDAALTSQPQGGA